MKRICFATNTNFHGNKSNEVSFTDFPASIPFIHFTTNSFRIKKSHFIAVIYSLFCILYCSAQPYSLKHLAVGSGLSNNYVVCLEQDKLGCIWIATMSGLNRFDGRNFVTYKTSNSDIASNALNTLLYDQDENKLWIGRKDGLSIFHCTTHQFENYTVKDGIVVNNIVHISRAADNGIWITNHHGNIVHYDKNTKRFTALSAKNIPGLVGSNWCSFDDGDGHLYVGHAQYGLSIVDLKNKTIRNFRNDPSNPKSLPGNSVYSICTDHLENIWIGTDHGLALFHPQTGDFTCFRHIPGQPQSLIADHIYELKEMKDGTLWIASDIGGISILDLHNIAFVTPQNIKFFNIAPTNDKDGLSSGNVRSLLQDTFGNIWIGNYSSGVDFASRTPAPFHILPYIEKGEMIKNKPVWGVCADPAQQVWLGGENEIVIFRNNKLQKTYNISAYLSRAYSQVFNIKRTRQGIFWFGLYDEGLLMFNPRNNHFERIKMDINNIDVITFLDDSDGKLWVGTEYGIYGYAHGVIRKEDFINNQLGDKSIYGILRDRQGKLWIGTYGGGLSVFDKNNKLVTRITSEKGFCSNSISQLYLDSKGAVWAATQNGLGYFKDTNFPNRFEIYNDQQGLTDTYLRAIQEDKTGDIWISTNDGISLWNKYKRKFENYDYRDGIPMGNFIEGSACSTSDGTIYFGSLNGVCYFDPQQLKEKRQISPVQIIGCESFSKQIENHDEKFIIPSTNKGIELAYNQNSFRVSFSVTDYSQNQQAEYAYMMEGLDNTWYSTQNESQVTFRNIAPGDYVFKVKARLRNQDWDEAHVAFIPVHIYPPFWFAWYAKLFYIFLIGLGILLFIRSYKRRLELKSSLELEKRNSQNEQDLNNERLRFYTNITHELRTPLTLILGPLEDLMHDKQLPSPYNKKIGIIHGSAVRLLNLINQILEFRKTETQNRKLSVCKGDIGNLITEIGLRYKELNRNPKVQFHINMETDETQLYFDADVITTILNNLLSNAVKYTPEGEIRLILRSVMIAQNHYTEIEVSDTGYGIEKQALHRIFDRYYQVKGKHQASGTGIGLALAKSLTELHEGIILVDSTVNKGTLFKLRLLTDNTYPGALHNDEKKFSNDQPKEIEINDNDEAADVETTVLIVEDNDDIREYIATSLSPIHKTLVAADGKEGLSIAQKTIPDIIISDIMMPVMNGIEFCRTIKDDVRTCHIPVILLTAKDSIQDKEEGYESGADSYLTKPFSAKLLHSRIHNLLETRKKLAQQITARTHEIKTELPEDSIKLSKLDEEFLEKLVHLVEENLDIEKLDIAFMTERMNMSHSAFYRKVKGLTGLSANEFIRKIRIKNSAKLLLNGSCNISEAAFMTGFNDIGYFRECFKEEYGMSPSDFIKQGKK